MNPTSPGAASLSAAAASAAASSAPFFGQTLNLLLFVAIVFLPVIIVVVVIVVVVVVFRRSQKEDDDEEAFRQANVKRKKSLYQVNPVLIDVKKFEVQPKDLLAVDGSREKDPSGRSDQSSSFDVGGAGSKTVSFDASARSQNFFHQSIDSDKEPDVPSKIQVALSGRKRRSNLTLEAEIVQAVDLRPWENSPSPHPDPYVFLTLVPPQKEGPFITQVKDQEPHPVFNEKFIFKNIGKFKEKRLRIIVWDFDRSNISHPPIGETSVDLSEFESSHTQWIRWLPLKRNSNDEFKILFDSFAKNGFICISMQYDLTMERLTVVILEASDLPKSTSVFGQKDETIDSFVEVALTINGKKMTTKKSTTKTKTTKPYFFENFKFPLLLGEVEHARIDATVFSSELPISRPVGFVCFGVGARGRSEKHWVDVFRVKGRPIAQWHVLVDPCAKSSL